MRGIKFRGYDSLETQDWYYGSYLVDTKGHYICDMDGFEATVDPETVGQFTGHLDAKKVEIFEGDLVTHYGSPFKVWWSQRECKFMLAFIYDDVAEGIRQTHKDFPLDASGITVIGNIHTPH